MDLHSQPRLLSWMFGHLRDLFIGGGMKGAILFALAVGLCAVLLCAALFRFGWQLIRPMLYSAGWVSPTAHDLEVEGWKAERAGDTERAVARYAEALRLDPTGEAVRERLRELGADPDLVAPRPEPPTPAAVVAEAGPALTPDAGLLASVHGSECPPADQPAHTREPDPYPPGWDAGKVFAFVVQRVDTGVARAEIADLLTREGFTPEAAAEAVADAARARVVALHEAGRRNMLYGAMWFGGGLLVTVVSYQAAEGGGSYILAWGAMLAGVIQFFHGTTQRSA